MHVAPVTITQDLTLDVSISSFSLPISYKYLTTSNCPPAQAEWRHESPYCTCTQASLTYKTIPNVSYQLCAEKEMHKFILTDANARTYTACIHHMHIMQGTSSNVSVYLYGVCVSIYTL